MQMRMAKRRMVLALGLGILASTQSFVDDNETTKTEIESSHGAKKMAGQQLTHGPFRSCMGC